MLHTKESAVKNITLQFTVFIFGISALFNHFGFPCFFIIFDVANLTGWPWQYKIRFGVLGAWTVDSGHIVLGGPPEGLYLPMVSASNPHSSHETGGRAGGAGGGAGGYLCSE